MHKSGRQFALSSSVKVFFLAFILRFVVSLRGSNFDFASYRIVISAIQSGHFPWDTSRYNYGPIWGYALWLINTLCLGNEFLFRLIIIFILTTSDFAIYKMLNRRFGGKTGLIFLFNPVSIIISGYHNQFDNVAFALGAWCLLRAESNQVFSIRKIVTLGALFGTSISIKHDFLLFLIWIFFDKSFEKRSYFLISSIVVPILLILPFFIFEPRVVTRNYFLYRSFNNAPLLKDLLFSSGWSPGASGIIFFIASITIIGFITKNLSLGERIVIYSLVFVAFSSSIANQYLIISCIGAAVYGNLFSYLFYTYCTIAFFFNLDELHFFPYSGFAKFFEFQHSRLYPILILGILLSDMIKKKRKLLLKNKKGALKSEPT